MGKNKVLGMGALVFGLAVTIYSQLINVRVELNEPGPRLFPLIAGLGILAYPFSLVERIIFRMLVKIDVGVQKFLESVAPGTPDMILRVPGSHLMFFGKLLIEVVPIVNFPVIHPGALLPAGEQDRQIGIKGNILFCGGVVPAAADGFQEIVDCIHSGLLVGGLKDDILIINKVTEAVGMGGRLPNPAE